MELSRNYVPRNNGTEIGMNAGKRSNTLINKPDERQHLYSGNTSANVTDWCCVWTTPLEMKQSGYSRAKAEE